MAAVQPLAIPDVKLVTPRVHRDARGFFVERWRDDLGIGHGFVQEGVLHVVDRPGLQAQHIGLEEAGAADVQCAAGVVLGVVALEGFHRADAIGQARQLGKKLGQFGIHPLHFAMAIVLNLTIGLATPPVGGVLFVMSSVARLRLEELTRAILPLLAALLVVLLAVVLIPSLSTFVPGLFGYTR